MEEPNDASITIQDHITVKVIKSLSLKFETYVTVLNKKAHNEKKLPDLDSVLKSLEEEEIRIGGKSVLNNVQTLSGGSSRVGRGGRSG